MTVLGREDDPREAAREYCRRLGEQLGAASVETPELTKINGLDACWANIADPSGDEPVDTHFVWIAHRGILYRITAFALEGRRDEVRKTILGFRPLSEMERDLIRETRIRIVEARQGETLAELSRWSVNAWGVEQTALINGIVPDRPLAAGVPVKVAVAQPYEVKIPSRASVPSRYAGVLRGE
jgi:predicted Zn-dependent protease